MKVMLQRVKEASVIIENEEHCSIGEGFLLFVGFTHDDNKKIVEKTFDKILSLRLFSDDSGKMNCGLHVEKHALLIVSQFTLYADIKKGRRPSFAASLAPYDATKLYEYSLDYCLTKGYSVQSGVFGADMKIAAVNDGPVTIILDSNDLT